MLPERCQGLTAKAHAFPKSARLSSRNVIGRVFSQGRFIRLGLLNAKVLPGPGPQSRFMISVRRRAAHAPNRARIKRLVRESLRLNRHRIVGAWDICLFLGPQPIFPLHFSTMEQEILTLVRKLNHAQTTFQPPGTLSGGLE